MDSVREYARVRGRQVDSVDDTESELTKKATMILEMFGPGIPESVQISAAGTLAANIRDMTKGEYNCFCQSFPYEDFLEISENSLDTELGKCYLRLVFLCSYAKCFPVDRFISHTHLLFYMILLEQTDASLVDIGLYLLARIISLESRILPALMAVGLVDRICSANFSDASSYLLEKACQYEGDHRQQIMSLLPRLFASDEVSVLLGAIRLASFAFIYVQGFEQELFAVKAELFSNFAKFSQDDDLLENYLKCLVLVHNDLPEPVILFLLTIVEQTKSGKAAKRAVELLCMLRQRLTIDTDNLCGILFHRAESAFYDEKRIYADAVSVFYRVPGQNDEAVCQLMCEFLSSYQGDSYAISRMQCIISILQVRGKDVIGVLSEDILNSVSQIIEDSGVDSNLASVATMLSQLV